MPISLRDPFRDVLPSVHESSRVVDRQTELPRVPEKWFCVEAVAFVYRTMLASIMMTEKFNKMGARNDLLGPLKVETPSPEEVYY
jgi:hypothetical protein